MTNSLVRFRLVAAVGMALAIGSAQAQTSTRKYLNIGDPAPAISSAKWLKGTPIKGYQKGHVYVVEFWATWCGPCKESIPHLTAMAKKYAGKASIAGINIWESNDPTDTKFMTKVESFVKDQGDKMDYIIGADGSDRKIADAWMKAADEGGIPTSFIVGKDGKLAWIGHPMNLEKVLSEVVDDKFDVAAARARRATDVEVTRPIREAIAAKDWRGAIKRIDAAIEKKPQSAPMYTYDRLVARYHADVNGAIEDSKKILAEAQGNIGAYRMIASIFATYKDLPLPAYRYGKTLIGEALEKKEMEYMFLAMGAEISASLGDKAGAIKAQEEAIKAAEASPYAPKEFVEFLRKNLEKLKALP
ncbi:MAG: redoxin domain-containing protein [Fimbriimonas sp.]